MGNPCINTKSLVDDINYFKSPTHYIKNEEGNFIDERKMIFNNRFADYTIAKITLLFRRLCHSIRTLGTEWKNDRFLLQSLKIHLVQLQINENYSSELEILTTAFNDLSTRIEGKVTNYTLSRLNLKNDLENTNQILKKNLQETIASSEIHNGEIVKTKNEMQKLQKDLEVTDELKILFLKKYQTIKDSTRKLSVQLQENEKKLNKYKN